MKLSKEYNSCTPIAGVCSILGITTNYILKGI